MRRLLLACGIAGAVLALGGAPAAAAPCCSCGCGTVYGLGYVPYYHYYLRRNYYQPCCGDACARRRSCDYRGHGRGWPAWQAWLSW